MHNGFATRSATAALANQNNSIAYNELGPRKLYVSQAGFGCNRVSGGVRAHANALTRALSRGVNLIDTSTNYADGGSEILVGKILDGLFKAGSLERQQVVVVSKVGYLQGRNLDLSRQKTTAGQPFKERVPYGADLEHCIHPGSGVFLNTWPSTEARTKISMPGSGPMKSALKRRSAP